MVRESWMQLVAISTGNTNNTKSNSQMRVHAKFNSIRFDLYTWMWNYNFPNSIDLVVDQVTFCIEYTVRREHWAQRKFPFAVNKHKCTTIKEEENWRRRTRRRRNRRRGGEVEGEKNETKIVLKNRNLHLLIFIVVAVPRSYLPEPNIDIFPVFFFPFACICVPIYFGSSISQIDDSSRKCFAGICVLLQRHKTLDGKKRIEKWQLIQLQFT